MLGSLAEARMHHYYIGAFGELKAFTRDFVEGEIRYFSQKLREPGATLEEAPSELLFQGNFDRDMARGIFRMAMQDAVASRVARGRYRQAMVAVGPWPSPAIFDDAACRPASATAILSA